MRDDLSFASFRHAWIYRGSGRQCDRRGIARGRAPSVSEAAPDLRQTHKQLIDVAQKRRAERTKQHVCHNERLIACQNEILPSYNPSTGLNGGKGRDLNLVIQLQRRESTPSVAIHYQR